MPLTGYVNRWVAGLERLLLGDASLVDVPAPAENVELVSRIVVNWANRDGGEVVFLGVDWSSAASFGETLRREVVRAARALEEVAAGDGLDLGEPFQLASSEDPASAVHALNDLARGLDRSLGAS